MKNELKKWVRNCPSCNIELSYSRKDSLKLANDNNRCCKSCSHVGNSLTTEHKNKIGESLLGRLPWNKGLTKDDHPSLKLISDKITGKIVSGETRDKISKFQQTYWTNSAREQHSITLLNSDKFRESNNSERSKKISDSHKNSKLVQSSIRRAGQISAKKRTGKTYEDIFGAEVARRLKEERRTQAIKQNTDVTSNFGNGCSLKKDTQPELDVQQMLTDMGIEYYTQYPIWSSYPLTQRVVKFYDIKLKHTNILIEVHGDYWHGSPSKYSKNELNEIQLNTIYNDTIKHKLALDSECVLFVIWETETKNKKILYEKISKILSTGE